MKSLVDYYSIITISLEILAAVTGLLLYKKYKHTAAKYFIYFLVYIVIMVFLGRYSYFVKNNGIFSFLDGTLLEKNYWYFTLFWNIVGSTFFGWYFSKIIKNRIQKKILRISVLVFWVLSMIIIFSNWQLFFTNSIPSISVLSAVIILQCVCFYFMEILRSDKILTFHKSLNFYICCAILVLWLLQTPLSFFNPYYRKLDMDYVNLRGYINLFVIAFMYITYTIGLIISNPKYD